MADTIKVLIEIPEGSNVKYELDEDTGEMMVDRIVPVAMGYPVNYGLITDTRGEDGDALDALVFLSERVVPGVVINCKVIGMLEMEDEEGIDHKIICVPEKAKIDPVCGAWSSLTDISEAKKRQIRHFFEHYKDLEEGKWVKLKDWQTIPAAETVLKAAQNRFDAEAEADGECCSGGHGCEECVEGKGEDKNGAVCAPGGNGDHSKDDCSCGKQGDGSCDCRLVAK